MKCFLEPNKNENLCIALGFFDGVHLAHQELIKTMVDLAKDNGLKSAVVTFQKSPVSYFLDKPMEYLITREKKLEVFAGLGLDYAYMLDFKDFMGLSAQEYLKNILIKNFNPKYIVTGFNHTFGSHRMGDSEFLRKNEGSYTYVEVEKQKTHNVLISSTNIKKFIAKGFVEEANFFMGREFSIKGNVIKGMQLGRKIGFKTANVEWKENIIKLPYGVYSSIVKLKDGKNHRALVNWGVKPTIEGNHKEVLEAHLLNFDDDIYEQDIEISFLKKIRDESRFDSLEDLKAQIKLDLKSVNFSTGYGVVGAGRLNGEISV